MGQAEPTDRLTINLMGLREDIEEYAKGDPKWEELEMAGKIRSLIRKALKQTPFTQEFVEQSIKFGLGIQAIAAVENFRQDESWQSLSIEAKLTRLVEVATNLQPKTIAQALEIYWDLLIDGEVDLPVKRLGELRRGEGKPISSKELQTIAQIVPMTVEELEALR